MPRLHPPKEPIRLCDIHAQYQAYQSQIQNAITNVLDSSDFILGKAVRQLEAHLATYTQSRFALTCSSGTSALLLALLALGIQKDDEVITPCFSFIAAAEMIAFIGAKPVFVDICEDSYLLDASKLESKITKKTKAIIPVSLFGQPYDVEQILEIAKAYNLAIIEDGAQSFGATYTFMDMLESTSLRLDSTHPRPPSRLSPTLGDIGITSFFPSKPLGGYGDGGAIFCQDEELYEKILRLRNHGQSTKYEHKLLGCNARLDSLACAIVDVKLSHFDEELLMREKLARNYYTKLDSSAFTLPFIHTNRKSVFAQFCLKSKKRESILSHLANAQIPTAIHYPKPLHLQESMRFLGHKIGDFPIAEQVCKEIFSIPFYPFLSQTAQDYIIKVLNTITKE